LAQSGERLSLQQAIAIALQQNPDITGAQRAVDAAHGRFWQGVSLPPPSLVLGYDYIPTGSGIAAYGERSIGISQSFDFPTTIALRGSSLTSEIDAATEDARSTSHLIVMKTKLAYFSVLARQEKLMLTEENLQVAEDFARTAGIRLNVGEGTNLEHLTAMVQLTQSQNDVESARNQLRIALSELNLVLGGADARLDKEYILTDTLSHRPLAVSLESLSEHAHNSNPVLRSSRFRLDAASSGLLPSFALSYARQKQGGNADLYGVALEISVPIWFLFDQRGRIQEASAEYAGLNAALTAQQRSVSLAVKNAYLEFTDGDRQVRLYDTALLLQAREVYRAAAAGFQTGEISYLEFLQARQTLISVRGATIDALYHYNATLARLEFTVGSTLGE
jgi:outer membrane protein TolC